MLRDKLRNGELDAIIIALPFLEADVLTKPLYDEPFYALLPAGHPWAAMKTIDSKLLNDKSLLLLGEGHCFRDQVLEACTTLRESGEDSVVLLGRDMCPKTAGFAPARRPEGRRTTRRRRRAHHSPSRTRSGARSPSIREKKLAAGSETAPPAGEFLAEVKGV